MRAPLPHPAIGLERPLACVALALAPLLAAGCDDAAAPGAVDVPSSGILYVSDGQLHAMRIDGSAKTRVTDLPEVQHRQPQVSADGRQVIVLRTSRTRSDLVGTFVMNIDGSSVRGPLRLGDDYRWSPDGRRIASVRVGGQLDSRIVITPTDGSASYDLTPGGFADDQPAWSPEGDRVLFRRLPAGSGSVAPDLYVVAADGGTPVNLTNDAALERAADWSPDGERVAFTSPDRGAGGLFVAQVAAAGGAAGIAHLSTRRCLGRPRWAPDGETILCVTVLADGSALEVALVRADGAGERVIATGLATQSGGFAWSPDGERILFQSRAEGVPAVFTMRADGGDRRMVADGATGSTEPQWYER